MPHDTIAGTIMDSSAALLNDVAKQVYTYVAQLPYLKIALAELREEFELNNIPVTNATSAVIAVNDGVTVISFTTTPALPSDLVELQQLWERQRNIDPFIPMNKREFLPHYHEGIEISQLIWYTWNQQRLEFLPSNQDNDIKIDYIRTLFTNIVDQNSVIGVINADSYLHYRTAALCAHFIGENKTRSDELNGFAQFAMDKALGIGNKGKQNITTRRRPFRAAYKRRGLF